MLVLAAATAGAVLLAVQLVDTAGAVFASQTAYAMTFGGMVPPLWTGVIADAYGIAVPVDRGDGVAIEEVHRGGTPGQQRVDRRITRQPGFAAPDAADTTA